ncbi:MAG: hypothetical protein ACRDYA_23890 [Egibacteraceae bacterium]
MAAVLGAGRHRRAVGSRAVPGNTAPGYQALLGWLGGFGTVERVGVEGTGSYAVRPDPPPRDSRGAGSGGRPGGTGKPDVAKASPTR